MVLCFFLGLADVTCDDYYVLGGLVSIFHCMSLGIIWWPQGNTCSYGNHCSTLCQVVYLLQPLHLCHCKQKVSLFIYLFVVVVNIITIIKVYMHIIINLVNTAFFHRFRRAIIGMIRCQTRQQITINTEIPMTASQQTATQWDGSAILVNHIDVPWQQNY